MFTRGKHDFKFGAQSLGIFVHDYDPNTFNGAYVFGGGKRAGSGCQQQPHRPDHRPSRGIEQYQRALQNLPGGSPTTYQITSGDPLVPLTQWQVGSLCAGRHQTRAPLDHVYRPALCRSRPHPAAFSTSALVLGFAWAADKKETWVFHLQSRTLQHSPERPNLRHRSLPAQRHPAAANHRLLTRAIPIL